MKKLINIILISAAIVSGLSSCSEDLGNYTYKDIDSLLISDIQDTIDVDLGSGISITPSLNFSDIDASDDDFTYEWTAFDLQESNSLNKKKVLSTTKNLDMNLSLGVGNYPLYFTVKQISTGRIWTKEALLRVNGAFGNYGWFVLHDKSNSAHLDFFEDDPDNWNTYPKHYADFNQYLSDENTGETLSLDGEGISLACFNNRDAVMPSYQIYMYVNTTSQTTKINVSAGYTVNDVKYNFKNETLFGQPSSAEYVIPFSAGTSAAFKDNNLYNYRFIVGTYYNLPLNRGTDGSVFDVSKYIAAPTVNSYMSLLFFDTTNRRFMKSSYASAYAQSISTASQAFDAKDVGKDLVWLGYTRLFNSQAVAILKDGSSYYLARMGFTTAGAFTATSLEDVTSTLTGLADAEFFTLDQEYGYLYYTSGDKLYQYDMDAKMLKVARTFTGRKASMLKYQRLVTLPLGTAAFTNREERLAPVGYSVILGTYEESNPTASGKVEFLRPQALMGDLQEAFSPFEGLGIVKDVSYLDRS